MIVFNPLNYLALDFETGTEEYKTRAPSPFVNPIIAVGLANDKTAVGKYIYPEKLQEIDLTDIDILVGHNIKYDLLYIWKETWLQDFFKKGGQIWDTQYAHYCITGQQSKYASLRDIAVNYYNIPFRSKNIEDLFFNRKPTLDNLKSKKYLIDPLTQDFNKQCELTQLDEQIKTIENYKYLWDLPKEKIIEDVKNDVEDTGQIYLKQLELTKNLGMYELVRLEMDAILATTEMEWNGMYINKDILETNLKTLQDQLQNEYKKLDILVSKYWR